jgi:Flp pilus assembly protein TadG
VRVPGRSLRDQRGAVTAETVMVLPLLVAVALGLAWLLALVTTQVRVVDAAREVARASARDESAAHALALGRRVAPAGSVIAVQQSGGTVIATVRTRVRGPHGLLAFLPAVEVESRAVAAEEPS